MIEHVFNFYKTFELNHPLTSLLSTITIALGLIALGIIFHKTLHHALARRFHAFIQRRYPEIAAVTAEIPILEHFLMLLVPIMLFLSLPLIVGPLEEKVLSHILHAIEKILMTYILLLLGILTNTLISGIELAYKQHSGSQRWPIRSYVQFTKGFTFIVYTILIVSYLLGKSPLTFLTGLGAIMAVITLIFKDAILSFVSSVQLATSNMMQKGDWIEIPEKNISGYIIEMSLNTIKIQNFDKTISTVPPYYLTSNAVKNWRGMFEFGGRQIKLSFTIDVNTIQFADKSLLSKLGKLSLLSEYISENQKTLLGQPVTNLFLFRYYAEAFMQKDPRFITKEKTAVFMARVIQPSYVGGIPLEIYTYTKETKLKQHEHVQADLIEHLIAMMPQFELKLMQQK